MAQSRGTDPEQGSTLLRAEPESPRSRSPLGERFTPGLVVAERYRIISLIGQGGMGEVYRADDLKLGQRVALKYVPRSLVHDPAAMEQLLSEVRIGRQISHPNVCRLYDIVEVDGERFISMEFVEGEDLASLLRRIGRLPADKALAFAMDICAGLAAAHDRGVVHRDLKPGNVLIDERGTARITDFGLAAVAEELGQQRDFAGTPAYMAPEQLSHGEVSFRSDLYSLGLVLYEVFTGRRLFAGGTSDDIREQHAHTKTRPSSIVKDIHPAVERVILRCLEENPADRPPSIHAVIAALPGGDPLQAAVAAGETPSPGMVAAAGKVGDLSVRAAWGLLATVVALLAGLSVAATRFTLPARLGGIQSEPVLQQRARQIAEATGAPAPGDTWAQWTADTPYRNWRNAQKAATALPPGRLLYVYRQSPEVLHSTAVSSRISAGNPPPTRPGMSTVVLDHRGRLVSVRTVPPARTPVPGTPHPADWTGLLDASGADPATLHPDAPDWTPPVASDQRQAWSGTLAHLPGVPVRIEAASLQGEPVWFTVAGPWQEPDPDPPGTPWDVGDRTLAILQMLSLAVGAVFARRNIARGRADRRTAATLFVWIGILTFVAGLAVADHVPDLVDEWNIVLTRLAISLLSAAWVWTYYLAVEPYVRRRWPHMLISWTRLARARFHDPMVGRDLLIGAGAGLLARLIWVAVPHAAGVEALAFPPVVTSVYSSQFGLLWAIGYYSNLSAAYTLAWLVLLLLFRLLLRRPVLATVALWLAVVPATLYGINVPVELLASAASMAVLVGLLYRFGALALGSAFFCSFMMLPFYDAGDVRSLLLLATVLALVLYAFHASLAGKPAFGSLAMDEDSATGSGSSRGG